MRCLMRLWPVVEPPVKGWPEVIGRSGVEVGSGIALSGLAMSGLYRASISWEKEIGIVKG